jgi:WD40 repeat protein
MGRECLTLKGRIDQITSVCFSLDGQRIVAQDKKGEIRAWNAICQQRFRAGPFSRGGPGQAAQG